jgi:hypothetical protein
VYSYEGFLQLRTGCFGAMQPRTWREYFRFGSVAPVTHSDAFEALLFEANNGSLSIQEWIG